MATRSWSLSRRSPRRRDPHLSPGVPPAARRPFRVSPPVHVPTPPRPPAALDPLLMSWPTGEVVHRCCDVHRGCRNFSAGNAAHPGRFQPCTADRRRTPPPVLYGAGDVDTAPIDTAPIDAAPSDAALSETVFHDLPIRGSKHLAHAQLMHRLGVALIARRDLLLIDLTSDGPRRLGLTRGELIESDSRSYPRTAAWARALHDHWQRVDGLLWASGRRDTGRALLLFGDRIKVNELAPGEVRLTLGAGEGL